MIELTRADRWLRWSTALLLCAVAFLIILQTYQLHQREKNLTKLALLRTQQMLHVRLDAAMDEWCEDLEEEASVVTLMNGIDTVQLLERLTPLFASHWALVSVRVGDVHGNEIAVYRADNSLQLVITREGSKEQPPLAFELDALGVPDSVATTWSPGQDYDPRERIWFSKALENGREVPIWSIRQFGDTASKVLQVSRLIRSLREGAPYRVLLFDVELARSEQMDTRPASSSEFGYLLMSADGRILSGNAGKSDEHSLVVDRLHAAWAVDRAEKNFTIITPRGAYAAFVEPYLINGLTLHTCVFLDTAPLKAWTISDRYVVWIAAGALVLFAALLAGLLIRGRKRMAAVRQQRKQLQQQARKLEKVIGEREVLSREVHHRVKNNLQVVSSLLNLQASALEDGPVRDEFLRGKQRIDTIALVHHKLYGLTDLRNVDLQDFFTQLTEALARMHQDQSRTVSVSVDTDGIKSDQDTAIELGIILCELLTNAYKHAFPYATGGHVDVSTRRVEGDLHRLIVRNNGVALPSDRAVGQGKLGLEIVDALAGQLDGSFHVRTDGGVIFEVLFRIRRSLVNTSATHDDDTVE